MYIDETILMLEKTKVLPIIIEALKSGADDSFEKSFGILGADAVEKATDIANNIKTLIDGYDYFQSPDFLSRIEGKSEAYVNFVKESFSQAHEDRLLEAIRNVEHSDTIFNLIQDHQKQYVNAIRENLEQLYK